MFEAGFGVFSRMQAMELGYTPRLIQRRIASGEWRALYRGLYALASFPDSWNQRIYAAWLWAGPDATVVGRSAARLWNLHGVETEVVEVATARYLKSPGVVVHRMPVRAFLTDGVPMGPFRVSSVHRTLVELGAFVDEEAVEIALDDALPRRITTHPKLQKCLNSSGGRGRKGCNVLPGLLRVRDVNKAPTGSARETMFLRFLRAWDLPTPVTQLPLYREDGSYIRRLDFAYPQTRLGLEYQSYERHAGRVALDRDSKIANAPASIGWRLMWITGPMVDDEPQETAGLIRKAPNEPTLQF